MARQPSRRATERWTLNADSRLLCPLIELLKSLSWTPTSASQQHFSCSTENAVLYPFNALVSHHCHSFSPPPPGHILPTLWTSHTGQAFRKKKRNRNDKGEGLSYRGFYENVRFIFHYEDVEDEELWVGHPSRQTMDGASLYAAALYSGMNSMKWVRIILENVNVEIRRSVVLYIKSDIQNKVYP